MKKYLSILLVSLSPLMALEEEQLTWEMEGPSVQDYNTGLQDAIAAQDWWKAIDFADAIAYNFPTSPFAHEAPFIMGEAYYKLGQLEYSNDAFTAYLNNVSPKHFEEAIQYKFMIAEQFANGAKKRLFGSPKMPALLPAKEEALKIYDEVIAAMPHAEMTAKALLAKARIQTHMEDFKPSIETLDILIRRFPKSELAAEAYLEKNRIYLLECKVVNLDADLLELADVNLHKFRLAFPREQRLEEAEKILGEMQEMFAQSLFDMGAYYEKTKKVPGSLLYYKKVVSKYPATTAAASARQKLALLDPSAKA